MRKGLLLSLFILILSHTFGQGVTLLWRGSDGQWNNPNNWIQINTPVGQTPIQRVPTEIDHVRISSSMSGISTVNIVFPGSDSLVIGENRTTGNRCRSMHVSNTQLYLNNESFDYNLKLVVHTGNGGKLVIDSSSKVPRGHFVLNGGNPAVKDLEILNSQFGTLFSHENWSNIFIQPNGKARLLNSAIEGYYIGSVANGGELITENCSFLINSYILGENSVGSLINSTIANDINNGTMNFHIGKNSVFNSANVNITSFITLNFYTSGATLRGNVTLLLENNGGGPGSGGGLFKFGQADPSNPLPNIIDGNLTFTQGSVAIRGDVKISGDLINYGVEPLFYPDTAHVFVSGQDVFKIGGINNFLNNVTINNCVDDICHFKFEFFGNTNSRVKWDVGFPLDTMIVNKTGCAKVTIDNSLYIAGQLMVQAGQLVLNPNDGIAFKMVTAGNVIVSPGAGIFLRRNAAGVPANIAIGGTLIDNNTTGDSTCSGISNPYNGTILSYNPSINIITVPICVNSSSTLTSIVTGSTYRWEQNTGSGFAVISNNANFSGVTSRVLQLTNIPSSWSNYIFRCIVNGNIPSHTFRINVVSSLPASVSITFASGGVCQNAPNNFTAHPVNGGQSPNFQWQVNGINAGTNSPTFSSSSLANNSVVKVIMTSSFSCAVPATATSNSITIIVANTVVPSVSIVSSAVSICSNTSVTFTATPVNGGLAPIYQWKKNGINVGTNNAQFISADLASGDVITATMVSNAACASAIPVSSNAITINVTNSVIPGITISGSLLVNLGDISTITLTTSNAGSNPTYQWQDSTPAHTWQNIAGANNPVINYSALSTGDKIRALLTSSANCANPSVALSNVLSFTVSQPASPGRVTIYPNPAQSFVMVDSLSLVDAWSSVTILSIEGKIYFTNNISGRNQVKIPIQNLLPGIYIIRLNRSIGGPVYKNFIKL